MKVYELLSFNQELIAKIDKAGIRVDDYRYISLYEEYVHLKKNGDKVTYIVNLLAEKYNISERQVYNIICRLKQDITTAILVQLE